MSCAGASGAAPLLIAASLAADDRRPVRDLVADRPDTTESPISVEPGRLQIETSVYDFSRDTDGSRHTLFSSNIKTGVSRNSDLQFVWDAYAWDRPADEPEREGLGDLGIRFKQNLYGNDSGRSALAVMPHVTVPAGTRLGGDTWEGGLIVPWSFDVSDRFALGAMIETDWVRDDSGGHDFLVLHSGAAGFTLAPRLGVFLEYVGTHLDGVYAPGANAGITVSVSDELVLDAGIRRGFGRDSDVAGFFTGFTLRF